MIRLTSLATGLLLASTALAGPVQREGEGDRRVQLNAMEAKAFPAKALQALDTPLGEVTVFVTVNQVAPESLLHLRRFSRMEQDLAAKGFKVIGVVDEASWDAIEARKQAGLVRAELALDRGGMFREAVLCDDDPDVYVMDRAGQLRYADVTPESAAKAVEELLAETKAEAAGALARREAMLAAGEDPFASPEPPTLADIPAEAYLNANWPAHNRNGLSARDKQGEPLPRPLGNETWIDKKDREPSEHVVVLDFWATWCGPCIRAQPKLSKLQKTFDEDLMILAIGGSGEDLRTVQRYVKNNPKPYYNLFDGDQTVSNSLQVRGIPHTVVMSTDGVIRWQGNPLNQNFERIVEQVINNDPYIAAKREFKAAGGQAQAPAAAGSETGTVQRAAAPGRVEQVTDHYAAQSWPAKNEGKLYASDVQGKPLENPLAELHWFAGEAPKTEDKVTIIDFWATWCGPCKAFSPTLDKVQKRFADDVVAVAVSGQNDPIGKVGSHIEQNPVSYHHAYADDQSLYREVGVTGIPHVLILSSDGVVRWQGFPGAVPNFEALVTQIVIADRKARAARDG